MAKYKPTPVEEEFGEPSSGAQDSNVPTQAHPNKGDAEAYSSADDDKATGYGKTTGKTDYGRKPTVRRSW